MAVHVVNEKDVEKKKSGRGYTKWLHVSPGGKGPEMMIRHWGPDTDIPVHSHPYHEMFYVLQGEVEIGGTTVKLLDVEMSDGQFGVTASTNHSTAPDGIETSSRCGADVVSVVGAP